MSASDKKRLRKEQNAAAMTEKQLLAQKEAKKLKAYTISFVVVMVLVVAIVIGVVATPFITGVIHRNTHAVNIGNRQLSTTQFSYYYYDAITNYYSNFQSNYGDYADLYAQLLGGVVSTIPLNQQVHDKETGKTWADYFIDEAKDAATWTYAIYDAAMADEDFKISEDAQKLLDSFEENLSLYATMYGFSSTSGYLRAYYGNGANMDTYKEYYTYNTIASEYASKFIDELEFNDQDYREYEKEKYHEFNSYSYLSYYISSSNYLTFLNLGTITKDENGKESTTYTDEDKAKALAAAKEDAEFLSDPIYYTETEEDNIDFLTLLNENISVLEINKGKNEEDMPIATEYKDKLYSSLTSNEDAQKWLSSSDRKIGDITMIENKTTGSDDKEVVSGYYVIILTGVNTNERKLANVRHILVKFSGGTTNSTTGETTYSVAEKEKAKKAAEDILALYNATGKTDEDFAKLAKEKSEDTGSKSNGGLIEGIYRDAGYVESFADWALDERKPGDTGIIESSYGYHVMYYKEDGELTYRDFMIDNLLTQEAYEAWEKSLTEKVTVAVVNLNGIETDYVIAG